MWGELCAILYGNRQLVYKCLWVHVPQSNFYNSGRDWIEYPNYKKSGIVGGLRGRNWFACRSPKKLPIVRLSIYKINQLRLPIYSCPKKVTLWYNETEIKRFENLLTVVDASGFQWTWVANWKGIFAEAASWAVCIVSLGPLKGCRHNKKEVRQLRGWILGNS